MLVSVIVGLLSDTHGRSDTTAAALEVLHKRGSKYLIHAGDICSEEILEMMAGTPGAFVFGNNDFEFERYRRLAEAIDLVCLGDGGVVLLEEKKIAVAHGDKLAVMRELIGKKPDYFIYGHSHVAMDTTEQGIRFINPGALHRAKSYTCATLDLTTGKLEMHEV